MVPAVVATPDYAVPWEFYRTLCEQAAALTEGEPDATANAANLAALLFNTLPEVNWAGFYFLRQDVLVVGPFQGRPACTRIPLGRGVCGIAAAQRRRQVVADVARFPGHIVCDPVSRAEFVAPLVVGERLIGVLDIDSPRVERFSDADQRGLDRFAGICAAAVDPACR